MSRKAIITSSLFVTASLLSVSISQAQTTSEKWKEPPVNSRLEELAAVASDDFIRRSCQSKS